MKSWGLAVLTANEAYFVIFTFYFCSVQIFYLTKEHQFGRIRRSEKWKSRELKPDYRNYTKTVRPLKDSKLIINMMMMIAIMMSEKLFLHYYTNYTNVKYLDLVRHFKTKSNLKVLVVTRAQAKQKLLLRFTVITTVIMSTRYNTEIQGS